jgi:cobyrinic acid a,c-diamide synthase
VAGVILNRVGSDGHEILLRESLAPLGIPVLGALRRDDRLVWRDRHLGLVPVAEQAAEVTTALDRLAAAVTEQIDLPAVVKVASGAPEMAVPPVRRPGRRPDRAGSARGAAGGGAVAGGPAFTFTYTDTVEALEATGLDVVTFDPLHDTALPEGTVGLVAGGGFPEVHAEELAANRPLLRAVRDHVAAGHPVWAECGGLLWLCRELDGHRMADVVPGSARMTDRLTLGYRQAQSLRASPLGPRGTTLRGHEFHYTALELDVGPESGAAGPGLELSSRWGSRTDGWATPKVLATYLHVHPGGDPTPVEHFARACGEAAARR